jgi:capsular polysaccharide biosynthesis protein
VSVVDPSASNKEQAPLISRAKGVDLPERLWTYDDLRAVEAMPVDFATGLASLAFIRAAIRRSARFCGAMALAGLLIGSGVYMAFPPAYQASTSVLVTYGPYEDIFTAPEDNQAIAQSRAVAELAMHKLGLRQSVSSFLAAYTVTSVSNRVLLITTSAPSSNAAVSRANAVAAAFLRFRAGQLKAAQNLVVGSLNQQINQAKQQVSSLSNQITGLSAQTASPAQRARLIRLEAERSQSASALSRLEQTASGDPARASTALAVKGSVVLDAAAPILHSRLKSRLFYAAIGLVLGLALAVGIVVIRALVSDRLRRRDDVARALGAPVELSVGRVRRRWWLLGRHGPAAAENADIRRIVGHLGSVVAAGSRNETALAVVPVDDPRVAAISLASLARSYAQQMGVAVVVADLCRGAPAARLLGVTEPGVHKVSVFDGPLVVAIPHRADVAPIGPLEPTPAQAQLSSFTEAVAAASASANLLLTLATLDPSLGEEHLTTWATGAVAFVTAGKSSATRIHTVGEMIRLAGVTLDSAVLVGADRTDESLGVAHTPSAEYPSDESMRPSR